MQMLIAVLVETKIIHQMEFHQCFSFKIRVCLRHSLASPTDGRCQLCLVGGDADQPENTSLDTALRGWLLLAVVHISAWWKSQPLPLLPCIDWQKHQKCVVQSGYNRSVVWLHFTPVSVFSGKRTWSHQGAELCQSCDLNPRRFPSHINIC